MNFSLFFVFFNRLQLKNHINLMNQISELEKQLKDIFITTFTKNCNIEGSEMTKEEADTINEIDISEVLENLKDVINNLLIFKQEYINTDKAELIKRNEQFESMLQKSEAEVRTHIRVEHQLKLHIESDQIHSEDLEKENIKYLNEIKELKEKAKAYEKNKIDRKESRIYLEKIAKLEDNLLNKEATISKLEAEVSSLKEILESPLSGNEKFNFKKGLERRNDDYKGLKQKFEDKAVGLQKLQKLIREKSAKPNKERGKLIRNSINDTNDITRTKRSEDVINSSSAYGKLHNRSISEHVRPKSVGKRPPSR